MPRCHSRFATKTSGCFVIMLVERRRTGTPAATRCSARAGRKSGAGSARHSVDKSHVVIAVFGVFDGSTPRLYPMRGPRRPCAFSGCCGGEILILPPQHAAFGGGCRRHARRRTGARCSSSCECRSRGSNRSRLTGNRWIDFGVKSPGRRERPSLDGDVPPPRYRRRNGRLRTHLAAHVARGPPAQREQLRLLASADPHGERWKAEHPSSARCSARGDERGECPEEGEHRRRTRPSARSSS